MLRILTEILDWVPILNRGPWAAAFKALAFIWHSLYLRIFGTAVYNIPFYVTQKSCFLYIFIVLQELQSG